MQVIQINSLSGHSPYDITICDITKTYCYSGVTGATTVPLTINIPTELLGTNELLIVVKDSVGCETFHPYYCITPTPTPTPTITPTITPTNISCNCITLSNTGLTTGDYSYVDCNGGNISFTINSGTTLYVCGKSPIVSSGVTYSMGLPCSNNTCVFPTPTPTSTPTITETPTNTPTPTMTHTINCVTPILNSVTQLSGSTYGVIFSTSYACTSVDIEYSRDTVTWTADTGTCSTSRIVDTGNGSGTWYFRIIQLCAAVYTTGNTLTYIPATPNPTPTMTPTPTYPYNNLRYTYIVPEPQDSISLTDLGTYMVNSGSTSFLGWGNGGVPSTTDYSNNLNVYIHYSGFTGGSGNFISNVGNLKSLNTTDNFGCTSIGIFNTIEINPTYINPNIQYFYSIWIPIKYPLIGINNVLVNIGNASCQSNILFNGVPDTSLFSQNVFVTSGAAIPEGYYKVLWVDPSCLLPSSITSSLYSPLYFKGNSII
jgi:hypothetical protein